MSTVLHATSQSFSREVLQSPMPVLVDFYADWCGPCRRLAPTLDLLATEFAGQLKVIKVNIDAAPDLATHYQVSSIPTLLVFAAGRVVGRTTGLPEESGLRQALHQLVQSPMATHTH